MKKASVAPALVLALGLFVMPPACIAVDALVGAVARFVPAAAGALGLISPAWGQPGALSQKQSEALDAYDKAVKNFDRVLGERGAQIDSGQPLPNLPGQALYLARNAMIGARKDFTDLLPSKIGRPNKFKIPPAYFDADKEPLLDEYTRLFGLMQAPPAGAQNSGTPFKDVADLATAIARAKGLDAADAEAAGRIGLGLFFAETNGNQNIGNARSNTYKGSFQTGPSEDQNGRNKWASIKPLIAAFDPGEERAICVATRHGKRGNPVLWARRFFPEMLALEGDVGARQLIAQYGELVCEVEAADDGPLTDIDTPQMLAEYKARPASSSEAAGQQK